LVPLGKGHKSAKNIAAAIQITCASCCFARRRTS